MRVLLHGAGAVRISNVSTPCTHNKCWRDPKCPLQPIVGYPSYAHSTMGESFSQDVQCLHNFLVIWHFEQSLFIAYLVFQSYNSFHVKHFYFYIYDSVFWIFLLLFQVNCSNNCNGVRNWITNCDVSSLCHVTCKFQCFSVFQRNVVAIVQSLFSFCRSISNNCYIFMLPCI